jgi:hypothetical protein
MNFNGQLPLRPSHDRPSTISSPPITPGSNDAPLPLKHCLPESPVFATTQAWQTAQMVAMTAITVSHLQSSILLDLGGIDQVQDFCGSTCCVVSKSKKQECQKTKLPVDTAKMYYKHSTRKPQSLTLDEIEVGLYDESDLS